MADQHGRPIDAPASRMPDQGDDAGPRCVACHFHHGSVGAGRICLEREVRRLRGLFEGP